MQQTFKNYDCFKHFDAKNIHFDMVQGTFDILRCTCTLRGVLKFSKLENVKLTEYVLKKLYFDILNVLGVETEICHGSHF